MQKKKRAKSRHHRKQELEKEHDKLVRQLAYWHACQKENHIAIEKIDSDMDKLRCRKTRLIQEVQDAPLKIASMQKQLRGIERKIKELKQEPILNKASALIARAAKLRQEIQDLPNDQKDKILEQMGDDSLLFTM